MIGALAGAAISLLKILADPYDQLPAARGTGVILSTHDPDQAFAVASRVALMQDGMIVAQGTPSEVLTAAPLKAVYGVDVTVERLAGGQTVCAPVYPS